MKTVESLTGSTTLGLFIFNPWFWNPDLKRTIIDRTCNIKNVKNFLHTTQKIPPENSLSLPRNRQKNWNNIT